MAFKKSGSPVDIEVIKPSLVDGIICQKCNHVMIRTQGSASLVIDGSSAIITCGKCGEVNHGI